MGKCLIVLRGNIMGNGHETYSGTSFSDSRMRYEIPAVGIILDAARKKGVDDERIENLKWALGLRQSDEIFYKTSRFRKAA